MSRVKIGAIICCLACAAVSVHGVAPMTMKVRPREAFAPAFIRIEVNVAADADNRRLDVVVDSEGFYRSSEIQLDGAAGPRIKIFDYRGVPEGTYQVSATLHGTQGRRAFAAQWVQVAATSGDDR